MATCNNFRTAIVYHRVDWDGYTSAAIALKVFPEADLIGYTYGDPFPDVSEYDRVVLVDLTIYKDEDFSWMEENRSKLIWIDHHPVIHEVPGEFEGLRLEGLGACWLTWTYFRDNYQRLYKEIFDNAFVHMGPNADTGIPLTDCTPEHVRLVATYDTFSKSMMLSKWRDAWAYQLYLNQFGPGYTLEKGDISNELVGIALNQINKPDISGEVAEGGVLEAYRKAKEHSAFKEHAIKMAIGDHIGWLVESNEQPSLIVKDHLDAADGDFFLIFSRDKKDDDGNYKVSIRVPESSDFDALAFAKAYHGGGYPKACGCYLPKEMIRLLLALFMPI